MSQVVWVTHQFVAWHSWPQAPPTRAYLADPHRHLFKVKASVEVVHDDRDIEFHDLQDVVRNCCDELGSRFGYSGGRMLGAMSCEMIAEHIAGGLLNQYPGRAVSADVSEDGEVGATVTVERAQA